MSHAREQDRVLVRWHKGPVRRSRKRLQSHGDRATAGTSEGVQRQK